MAYLKLFYLFYISEIILLVYISYFTTLKIHWNRTLAALDQRFVIHNQKFRSDAQMQFILDEWMLHPLIFHFEHARAIAKQSNRNRRMGGSSMARIQKVDNLDRRYFLSFNRAEQLNNSLTVKIECIPVAELDWNNIIEFDRCNGRVIVDACSIITI